MGLTSQQQRWQRHRTMRCVAAAWPGFKVINRALATKTGASSSSTATDADADEAKRNRGIVPNPIKFLLLIGCVMFWWVPPFVGVVAVEASPKKTHVKPALLFSAREAKNGQ